MCDVRDSARKLDIVLPFPFGGIAQTMAVPVPKKNGFGRFMRPRLEALCVQNLAESMRAEGGDLAGWVIVAAQRMTELRAIHIASVRHRRHGRMRIPEDEYLGYAASAALAACFVDPEEVQRFERYRQTAYRLSTCYKTLKIVEVLFRGTDACERFPAYQFALPTLSAARIAKSTIRAVRAEPRSAHVSVLTPEPVHYDAREDGWHALKALVPKRRPPVFAHIVHTYPGGVLITEKIVHDANCATVTRGGLRLVAP